MTGGNAGEGNSFMPVLRCHGRAKGIPAAEGRTGTPGDPRSWAFGRTLPRRPATARTGGGTMARRGGTEGGEAGEIERGTVLVPVEDAVQAPSGERLAHGTGRGREPVVPNPCGPGGCHPTRAGALWGRSSPARRGRRKETDMAAHRPRTMIRTMIRGVWPLAALAGSLLAGGVQAQTATPAPSRPDAPATPGAPATPNAETPPGGIPRGVIEPRRNRDPEAVITPPPTGGTMPVIPPPATAPGSRVEPK